MSNIIKVYINKQSNFAIGTPKIKTALIDLLLKEGIVSKSDVSVSVVGKAKMLSLAKKYLNEKDVLHNVLSFPFAEAKGTFIEPPDNVNHLGEIVICYPKVVEEAQKEGKLIDDKVVELVNHGALHLLGKHHD